MKNTKFLKQNLLITSTVIFSWVIGYYVNFYDYAELWFLSLLLIVIYTPLAVLQYIRTIKNQDVAKLTKSIHIVIWVFISICLLPVLYDLFFEINSIFTYDGKFVILPFHSYFTIIGIDGAYETLLRYSPYLIVMALLFVLMKNKKIKEVK